MGSDFDDIESSVPGIKRYWAVLYVFKFYNSNDIFFSCTVTVCPSGSSSCDIVSLHYSKTQIFFKYAFIQNTFWVNWIKIIEHIYEL